MIALSAQATRGQAHSGSDRLSAQGERTINSGEEVVIGPRCRWQSAELVPMKVLARGTSDDGSRLWFGVEGRWVRTGRRRRVVRDGRMSEIALSGGRLLSSGGCLMDGSALVHMDWERVLRRRRIRERRSTGPGYEWPPYALRSSSDYYFIASGKHLSIPRFGETEPEKLGLTAQPVDLGW